MASLGAAGMSIEEDGVKRDKKVCEIITRGDAVTQDQMPEVDLLGQQSVVYFAGKSVPGQVEKCHDLGVEVTQAQVAKSVRATYMAGESVPQEMMIDALGTLETK